MPIVSVPKILRTKLGDDGADALVEFFNVAQEANSPKEEIIEIVAEKFERRLAEELGEVRVEIANMGSGIRGNMAKMESGIREDMANLESSLRGEMANLESSLRSEMVEMKSELRQEMAEMNANLETKIAKSHADLIKWMFIFWVGQIGVILGILFAFFNK